jgi:hypothetical protein
MMRVLLICPPRTASYVRAERRSRWRFHIRSGCHDVEERSVVEPPYELNNASSLAFDLEGIGLAPTLLKRGECQDLDQVAEPDM